MEAIVSSLEGISRLTDSKWLVLLVAAVAPVAWGSNYYVADNFLPPDRPLFAATVRALPFGLLLLVFRRRLPHGSWWWRTAVLGVVNVGAFFVLVFVAAYHLPGGMAATLTAVSPVVVALLAWWLVRERPHIMTFVGAVAGATGVALLVLRAGFAIDPVGVGAAIGAVLLFSFGSVLVKRWDPPVDLLTFTAWQLVTGGLALLPLALLVESVPPELDTRAIGGFLYIGLVGTVLAYFAWFRGIARLPTAAVSLVGLLNPVSGTVIGVVLAGEVFGSAQAIGTALVLAGIVVGQPTIATRLSRSGSLRTAPSTPSAPPAASPAEACRGRPLR